MPLIGVLLMILPYRVPSRSIVRKAALRSPWKIGKALLIAAIAISPLLPAEAQMALPGSFDVNQGGAATYAVQIDTVPGTSGVEPKIAIAYDSQAGNGLLGVGWGVSGLSTISRCARGVPQDPTPDYRFCIDGLRMNVISGTYGANNAEYRTEREEFSKIVSYGTAGTGPAYFKVWTKAGVVMEFGNTADSRIEYQGKPLVRTWAQNKVTDAKGNYLTITYTESATNGDYQPARIDYTGNATTGLLPYASLQFAYENRPDTVPTYQAGSIVKSTQRMTKVQAYYGTDLAREYRFTYALSPTSKRSRLTSMTLCSGTGICVPGTSFAWSDAGTVAAPVSWSNHFGSSAAAGTWNTEATKPRVLADVDGDGLIDVIGFGATGMVVAKSTGTGLGPHSNWSNDFGLNTWNTAQEWPRHIADVNGDGRADIVGYGGDGAYVATSTGTAFSAKAKWNSSFGRPTKGSTTWDTADVTAYADLLIADNETPPFAQAGVRAALLTDYFTPRSVVDVTGDGRADLFGWGALGLHVGASTGTAFSAKAKLGTAAVSCISYTCPLPGGAFQASTPNRVLADVNGDGLLDTIVQLAYYQNTSFQDGVYVALSVGTGTQGFSRWSTNFVGPTWFGNGTATPTVATPFHAVDMNGDGMADVAGFATDGVWVALSTGTSFATATKWTTEFASTAAAGWNDESKYPRAFADMNGDGLPDIVGFSKTGVMVALSTGTGFAPATKWTTSFGFDAANGSWTSEGVKPRRLADMNGDGRIDIVGFDADGIVVALAEGGIPDHMTTITTGTGHVTEVIYKPLSKSDGAYTKDSGSIYPISDVQSATYVVTEVRGLDGLGGNLSSTYRYVGAKTSLDGRGSLGFRQMISRDEESQVERVLTMRQDHPFTGLTSKIEKKYAPIGGPEILLGQTTNSFASVPLNTSKSSYIKLTKSVDETWEMSGDSPETAALGVKLPVVTTDYVHDDWGNATSVTVSTDDGFSKTTVNTYTNDVANWRLGRLTRTTVTSNTPSN